MSWNCGEFVFEAVEYVGPLAGFFRAHFEVEFYPHFNLHKHDKQKGERRGTTHDKVMPSSLALDRSCLLSLSLSSPSLVSIFPSRPGDRGAGVEAGQVQITLRSRSLHSPSLPQPRSECVGDADQNHRKTPLIGGIIATLCLARSTKCFSKV